MKFSFEKPKKSPEVEKPELESQETQEGEENLSDLEQQERFDAECAQEAEKLEVGIETLKAEIDALGGPEKFKEIFEKPRYTNADGNQADKMLDDIDLKKWEEGSRMKFSRNIALVMGGMLALETFLLEGETISDKFDGIRQMWQDNQGDRILGQSNKIGITIGAMVTSAFALTGVSSVVQSIKSRFELRRLEKQKKIETLKFKMTGVEVNEG